MKLTSVLAKYKLKDLIIVSFIFIVVAIFFINFLIIKLFLFEDFKNELLTNRNLERSKSYANQLEDPLLLNDHPRAVAMIFENRYSRKDVAYQLVLDTKNTLIGNNFVGDFPNELVNEHILPADKTAQIKLIDFRGTEIYDIAIRMKYDLGVLRTGFYKNQIDQVMSRAVSILIISIIIPLVLAILLAFLYSAIILRPIKILKNGVMTIAGGNLEKISGISSQDEIGELAAAINQMTDNLIKYKIEAGEYSRTLEKKVKTKTGEVEKALESMQKDKNELESQRVAILNILEDVQDSEQELKESNLALDRGRAELEALKSLSDEFLASLNVAEAMNTAVKYAEKGLDYAAITILIFDPLSEEDVIFRAYLRKPVNEDILDKARREILDFLKDKAGNEMHATLRIISNLKPSIIGQKPDSKALILDFQSQVLPIIIGEQLSGAIHIASMPNERREFSQNFIKTVAATLSATVARLQIMNQTQHSKTETLIKSLSDGVIMFSLNKKIILANPAIKHLLKDKKSLTSISDLDEILAGLELDKNILALQRSGLSKRLGEKQVEGHYFEIIISPVKDSKDVVSGGTLIFHDITHLKEVDKMKTEFVSVASHQLRTPLTAIKLFTEMMVRGDVGELTADQKDYLVNIYESTERMVRLVNDLLSLSRLESGRLKIEPKPTSLIEMVASVIAEVKPLADSKKCEIVFAALKNKLPEIPMDPNLVRQVAHNLITNAVRYSKEGAGRVEISIRKNAGFYELAVKDNGIGISAPDQKRMFEKFFRADNAVKKETEGSGLGLYVCRMIAQVSGGKIWFESAVNQGTTFYLALPVKGVSAQDGEKTLPSDQHDINFS